eukprot:635016-Ditylum_brightwellii.AAC.1
MHNGCKRCNVIVAWGMSLHHSCGGNLGSVEARPAMKLSLNIWIAHSACGEEPTLNGFQPGCGIRTEGSS